MKFINDQSLYIYTDKSATSQLSDLNNLTSASPDLSSNGTATLKPGK